MSTVKPSHPSQDGLNELLANNRMHTNRDRTHPDPELWGVSLKFESLLLQQMLSAMRKTVPKSGLLQTGFANDVYDSMFDQAVAEAGSHRSSLGIASSIYRQLDKLYHTQAQPPGTDNTIGIPDQTRGEKHGAD